MLLAAVMSSAGAPPGRVGSEISGLVASGRNRGTLGRLGSAFSLLARALLVSCATAGLRMSIGSQRANLVGGSAFNSDRNFALSFRRACSAFGILPQIAQIAQMSLGAQLHDQEGRLTAQEYERLQNVLRVYLTDRSDRPDQQRPISVTNPSFQSCVMRPLGWTKGQKLMQTLGWREEGTALVSWHCFERVEISSQQLCTQAGVLISLIKGPHIASSAEIYLPAGSPDYYSAVPSPVEPVEIYGFEVKTEPEVLLEVAPKVSALVPLDKRQRRNLSFEEEDPKALCRFCGRKCRSPNCLGSHQSGCVKNPDSKKSKKLHTEEAWI